VGRMHELSPSPPQVGGIDEGGDGSSNSLSSTRWLLMACLCLVILLAFALRTVMLDSLPRSLSLDESADGLDALQLWRAHRLTPFVQYYFGRETLSFYVQALALWLCGINQFSFRFASAAVATLTIPLLYVASEQLKLDDLVRSRSVPRHLVGLLAVLYMATSYWHLYFSRMGQRAILLPPLLLCLVCCFWRGWQFSSADGSSIASRTPARRRRAWLAAAGALLGLSFYVYLASRLLPFLFGLFAILDILRDRKAARTKLIDTLAWASTAVLVSIPLISYFVQNPDAFSSRTGMISVLDQAGAAKSLAGNLLRLVWVQLGSGSWLGQWPSLNLLVSLGLLSGLVLCVVRIRRPAARFLLLWWSIGFLPVLLSQQDWEGVTTIQRGIVAWPAAYLISAVGLWAVVGRTMHWAKNLRLRPAWLASPLLLALLFGMLQDAQSYFFTWARAYDRSSDEPKRIAAYLNRQTSQLTLTPNQYFARGATNFLLQARYPNLVSVDATALHDLLASHQAGHAGQVGAVYLLPHGETSQSAWTLLDPSPAGSGTAYLLPYLDRSQTEAMMEQTTAAVPVAHVPDPQGEAIADAFPLDADAPFLPDKDDLIQPFDASFAGDVLLSGFRVVPPVAKPGEEVTLHLSWQAQRPIDAGPDLFIHLFNVQTGQRVAQANKSLGSSILLLSHWWPVGLTVVDGHAFAVPPDAPEGAYRFEVGLYNRTSLARLPIVGKGDQPADDKVVLGKLLVQRQPPPPPQHALQSAFEDNIALKGLDLRQSDAGSMSFVLHWLALRPTTQDYTVFTHLLDLSGNLVCQQDNVPQGGHYPTSLWSAGEVILDPYVLSLPRGTPDGRYSLQIGLYDPQTGRRLRTEDDSEDYVELQVSLADGSVSLTDTGE
jgi:hypothetical protein